jgi:hypothetical protein
MALRFTVCCTTAGSPLEGGLGAGEGARAQLYFRNALSQMRGTGSRVVNAMRAPNRRLAAQSHLRYASKRESAANASSLLMKASTPSASCGWCHQVQGRRSGKHGGGQPEPRDPRNEVRALLCRPSRHACSLRVLMNSPPPHPKPA